MRQYMYCYYCSSHVLALGQQVRCHVCNFELATLSSCGYVHMQTEERLKAQALTHKIGVPA